MPCVHGNGVASNKRVQSDVSLVETLDAQHVYYAQGLTNGAYATHMDWSSRPRQLNLHTRVPTKRQQPALNCVT